MGIFQAKGVLGLGVGQGWGDGEGCGERGVVRGYGSDLSRSTFSKASCSSCFNFSISPKVGENQGALSAQQHGGPDKAAPSFAWLYPGPDTASSPALMPPHLGNLEYSFPTLHWILTTPW